MRALRTVEGVGKAQIEGAVPAARRIERLGIDRIEALRRLAVALYQLGAEPAGPAADGIDGEALEAAAPPHPQLELELALEDADEDRRAQCEALRCQPAWEIRQVGSAGQRQPQRRLGQPARALGLDLDARPSR